MAKDIVGVKELRENLEDVIVQVERGHSFTAVRPVRNLSHYREPYAIHEKLR